MSHISSPISHEAPDANRPIQPVVLCGGSGTRLWPLSRKALPKQFAPLIGSKSLLQLTLERLRSLSTTVHCVASDEHRFLVKEAMDAAGVDGEQILEPVGRNTAAAMAAAALQAAPDELLLFAPADHHVPDIQLFASTVRAAIPAAEAGHFVTFGVVPTHPSSAYGYIQPGAALAGAQGHGVARFIEKPSPEVAANLLLQGDHLWNAGIFLVRAGVLLEALRAQAPDILASCTRAMASANVDGTFRRLDPVHFAACRSESIDYAVLEAHDRVAVLPFAGMWSDVGGWNAVAQLHEADSDGNRWSGKATLLHSTNTFVHAPVRPVVALGTQDLVVIDTQDAVLVAHKDQVDKVKDVVALLTRQGCEQATEHRRVVRPWGAYDSVDNGDRFQVKRLTLKPGGKSSLQRHHHRSEHWVVVRGTALVTVDGETKLVRENESVYIPMGATHRIENPGRIQLEVIEVQAGSYLGEDDIVRLDDSYGRVTLMHGSKTAAPD
ncbi:mannose-1-phosphate guanylyltransferase/mannose-6-phosphate isomerase [Luteibacter sp.]|uniref:mannose-1-phosphate guanylyltransferase/mannose-6-phosphate isomerase n=1 Tax=Luteibacter sp. TaxID=1886636 RepID=UPI002808EE9E|nr:mannose-1-phosphate guanylyltransferase/mannose-6-phosphate isomerase [Luteibacter sp.]MDQ7958983.1 mannose-1-phosphate guanylyltransferase/mannose-6-phosphate isomerase [Pseudomonadota bacterium]MDQ7998609.1 mannose-1-phosphate guanylyltransferase/mannose-6-phosphate isomerase [Pseudomonadota bacterium]MDQ8019314.1 mannose-1-phosphate guanylyltransferase/mannose-6-phosphate isomerase [Pseudomonadota bacterium]MDQ8050652.1 mannose-1-phosphate guanylyltransferase/mannose-6-phosphate isomerase